MPKLENFTVSLDLGVLKLTGVWKPDLQERKAAWEMYVELVTRISVVELKPSEGLVHEALSSLYELFNITRKILREYGPSVAQPKADGDISFGCLAISILNYSLRPFLAKWHPLLFEYEQSKKVKVTQVDHEKNWERNLELRRELEKIRKELEGYANLLSDVAKVPRIHQQVTVNKC